MIVVGKKRFDVLDSWRGLCAIFVAIYHFRIASHFKMLSFVNNSGLFVDFFFVLSGFVLAYSYSPKINSFKNFKKFIIRRIGRIWPLHVFILILFVVVEIVKFILVSKYNFHTSEDPFTQSNSILAMFSNVFLIHSIGIHDNFTWNAPSWSISVEFYTYLVFGCICLLFTKNNIKNLVFLFFAIFGASIIYFYSYNYMYATFGLGLFRCFFGFFAGCITFLIYKVCATKCSPSRTLGTFFEFIVAALIIYYISTTTGSLRSMFSPIVFSLVVFIFAFEAGQFSSVLNNELMQKLGKLSYSIYMLHFLFLTIVVRIVKRIESSCGLSLHLPRTETIFWGNKYVMDLSVFAYIFIIILLSSLTYKYVELPGKKFFNKFAL